MAATNDHIKVNKPTSKPLPNPPMLSKLMEGKSVVTKTDAEAFDKAFRDWWHSVQFTLEFDRTKTP